MARAIPNWATLPNLPKLESALDHATARLGLAQALLDLQRRVRLHHRPAADQQGPLGARRGRREVHQLGRVHHLQRAARASYDQYLLQDGAAQRRRPATAASRPACTPPSGKPKATLDAYRLPLWLPSTTLRGPGRDKVWGEARPAFWTGKATKQTQSVEIQFQAGGKGAWKTIDTVKSNGYFLVRPTFHAERRRAAALHVPVGGVGLAAAARRRPARRSSAASQPITVK